MQKNKTDNHGSPRPREGEIEISLPGMGRRPQRRRQISAPFLDANPFEPTPGASRKQAAA